MDCNAHEHLGHLHCQGFFFVAYFSEVIGYVAVEAIFFPMQDILMSDCCFLGHHGMYFHSQGIDVVV